MHMHADDFREIVPGNDAVLAEYFGVTQRTVRRWKSGEAPIPLSVAKLARLRYSTGELTGDASALLGDDWKNFRFGSDGKFYLDGWRGGFTPGQIRAMFFTTQLVLAHEATIRQLEKRIAGLEQDVIEANQAAAKYRGLVRMEARFGLMVQMERITG